MAIVPHTHWDREWYSPFQTFRLRLVDLLDGFLPRFEADASYSRFLLDGQMAVVDDYLAVRPEGEAVLKRLAGSGRLAMGPWYTLPDEFLVSGETLVRNLQMGMERATEFGGAMDVGYLPDMFGHVAQMPQLLRLAGMQHAVVWRGVPSAIDCTGFWWEAPDGSRVRAEYLRGGYSNGESIPDDAKALVGRIRGWEAEIAHALPPGGGILFMNGTDHQVPQPWLGRVVAEANGLQDDYRLVITSLAEYLVDAPIERLPTWAGELRSGARANVLMGVASNRVDVKQAAARAERAVERLAEPLCALFLPPTAWPEALLQTAWLQLVRNAAHDSVCACSVDEVCSAVVHRYAEARQIGEGLADRAGRALAASMAEPGVVVVNPSARGRGGVVQLDVPGKGPVAGAQVLGERGAVLADFSPPLDELTMLLSALRSQQIDDRTFINRVDVDEDDDGLRITLHADARLRTPLVLDDVKADVLERARAHPDAPVHVRILQPPSRTVLTYVDGVPGFGWTTWAPSPLPVPPAVANGATIGNGIVSVEVERADGTFSLDGHGGLDRLVDGGDHGDTYNYSPPEADVEVDTPESVEVSVLEGGPVRARLAVVRRYRWPERITRGSRVGEQQVAVTTTLELRAGEDFVRVTAAFENRCRDHRLRAVFPLPSPASVSRAECAFAVVERGLTAEGGPNERGLPTFPSRRFVSAGGLTIVHEGLLEYELVDGGGALALTLLRATGMLSRVGLSYRPLPAGPPIRMEGPQMLGPVEVRYAVHAGGRDPYALADDVLLPLVVHDAPGGGGRPAAGTALAVDGAEVSAVRQTPGGLEVRVFNPSASGTTVSFAERRGWIVDLRGAPVEPFDGSFTLRPWGIATVRLTPTE